MNRPHKVLEHAVVEQLGWDLLLDSSRISVKADDGTVTPTGVVYTYEESLLVEDDARSATGVDP